MIAKELAKTKERTEKDEKLTIFNDVEKFDASFRLAPYARDNLCEEPSRSNASDLE